MLPCYSKLLPIQYVRKKTDVSVLVNMSEVRLFNLYPKRIGGYPEPRV